MNQPAVTHAIQDFVIRKRDDMDQRSVNVSLIDNAQCMMNK